MGDQEEIGRENRFTTEGTEDTEKKPAITEWERSLGADIHLFVEYRNKDAVMNRWLSFSGEIRLERNYYIFERLGGVRGDLANAIVRPRGFPEDAGPCAKDENLLWIDYSGKEPNRWASACSPEEAKQWVESGRSKYFGTISKVQLAVDLKGEKEPELVDVRKPERVSQLDWHSHSWLSLTEFEAALLTAERPLPKSYAACLAAMCALRDAECEVRAVFWFDN